MDQIIYTSKAAAHASAADVFDIIASSARNNPQRDVTGFLVFTGEAFLQFIEGPPQRLDELLGVLRNDPRHRDLAVLSRHSILARCFPSWRMHRFDATSGDPEPVVAALRGRVGSSVLSAVKDFLQRPRQAA